jgi:putative integral membrane protein (TIGR02587 family)
MAARPVAYTLREYGRGVAGGLLFSLPLLYTMEVWWLGHSASPFRLIAFLGGTVALLVATSWAAGLRADERFRENVFEAAEELALGFITAAAVLALVGQFAPDGSIAEWVGKLTVEGAICALGVSVGTAQLGQTDSDRDEEEGGDEAGEGGSSDDDSDAGRAGGPRAFIGEAGFAALGAIVIAANVAPTEEIVMIAAEATRWGTVGIAAASLVMAVVLLNSDIRGSDRLAERQARGGSLLEAALTYAVALAVAAVLLWVFGQLDEQGPAAMLAQVVVLAFPATLGAAAGRLLLHP